MAYGTPLRAAFEHGLEIRARPVRFQPGCFKCFAHPAQALCEPLWFVQLSFGRRSIGFPGCGISEAAIGLIEVNTTKPLGV